VTRRSMPADPASGPVAAFAHELRALRDAMGAAAPTVDEISERKKVPRSTLYAALDGNRLPRREVVAALVRSWGGDEVTWMAKRSAVEDELGAQRADSPRRLQAQLRELRVLTGAPSVAELARTSGGLISKSTVHQLLNRTTLPRWRTVERFILACQQYAHAHGSSSNAPPEEFDLQRWREVYKELTSKAPLQTGDAEVAHQDPCEGSSYPGSPVEDSIAAWDPFELGVHPAITPETYSAENLPALPSYVRRYHDDMLDLRLSTATRNTMLVIVGHTTTGKTRSAYEAVRRSQALRNWRLVHPKTAKELERLLHSQQIQPHTLLWLDDVARYLSGPAGEKVARLLHTALESSSTSPVVVLGTLWAESWAKLTASPNPEQTEEQPLARKLLLRRAEHVAVPDTFTSQELLRTSVAGTTNDPRLVNAAMTAAVQGRRMIQAIAGGPAVVSRYQCPTSFEDRLAHSIITAAVDARRLGFQSPLPPALLEHSSADYLETVKHSSLPADWFDIGLAAACRPVDGISPLTPSHRGWHHSAGNGALELHDYLEHHGRMARRGAPVPAALWDALLIHAANPDDQLRIARNAHVRLLYYYAEPLYRRAHGAGYPGADVYLADLLTQRGSPDEAEYFYRQAAAQGDNGALARLADLLTQRGSPDEAEYFYRQAAAQGDNGALARLADLLTQRGSPDEAEYFYRQAAAQGDNGARWQLVHTLLSAGRLDDALDQLRELADVDQEARARMATLLAARGDIEELRTLTKTGDPYTSRELTKLLIERGHMDELYLRIVGGDEQAGATMVKLRSNSDEIEQMLRDGLTPDGRMTQNGRAPGSS
jgi:TPR repeat protein